MSLGGAWAQECSDVMAAFINNLLTECAARQKYSQIRLSGIYRTFLSGELMKSSRGSTSTGVGRRAEGVEEKWAMKLWTQTRVIEKKHHGRLEAGREVLLDKSAIKPEWRGCIFKSILSLIFLTHVWEL